jgi:glucose/arabinose dehydrogenase
MPAFTKFISTLSSFCLAVTMSTVLTAATSTERIATGLVRGVFVTAPSGDTERLFIVEQRTGTNADVGRIRIMDLSTNTILATPFLEIPDLATENEQGLLGLAFDPDYVNNGYFYVNFNLAADGGDTHIRRYSVDGDPATSNLADAASGLDILVFNQPQINHNGGWIGFSPSDPANLYIASGDGGGGNDDDAGHTAGTGNAQDITNNLLGKMLRINPSRDESPGVLYTIPADNPLIGRADNDEIWAYGLRNPFRASFDRETGDLWIGDVGQNAREEIDFQPANSPGGENYGWRLREGTIATPGAVGGPPPADNVEPIYDYPHPANGAGPFEGNVVIGGYVYRGPVAEFGGHYFFADSGSDNIWKLDPHAVDVPASVTRVNSDLTPNAGSIANLGSFGEDEIGNLYLIEVFGGELFRIVSDSEDAVWNGDAAVGTAGDGTTWDSADNWSRGGSVDANFVTDDSVIFVAGSSQPTINLGADRTVAAVRFEAPFTLQNNELQVLSGNVTVDDAVTATIESNLVAESALHSIRKLGQGTLLVEGSAGQIAVLEGAVGGAGTLDHLTVNEGGTAAPGSSIGTLQVNNSLSLLEGSTLDIELGSLGPDLVAVGGDVTLGGSTLAVSFFGGFVPTLGDQFEILDVGGMRDGQFAGLGEGDQLTADGTLFRITYLGGDGNDVVLTAIPEPASLALAVLLAGLGMARRRQFA